MPSKESPTHEEEARPASARHEIERLVPETEVDDWKCVECGNVRETSPRPSICPSCKRDDGDMPAGVLLFAPLETDGNHGDSP